jgi:hypothetical protein
MSTATQEKAKEEPMPPARSVGKESKNVKDEHHREDQSSCKKTLGEELFLVHLNRFEKLERTPTDFDHTTNPKEVLGDEAAAIESGVVAADAMATRTAADTKATEADGAASTTTTAKESTSSPTKIRAASIGEELWEVHCRRTQGLPPDYDEDEGEEAAADNEKMKKDATSTDNKKTGAKKKNKAVRAPADGATTKRVKVAAVEQPAREIHLRNRDVKVGGTTTNGAPTTKSQH